MSGFLWGVMVTVIAVIWFAFHALDEIPILKYITKPLAWIALIMFILGFVAGRVI